MKVYLIGMPGSGKSTLGKQLAETLHLPFVDLDAEIEKATGKLIKDIFSQQGEDFFRTIESQTLQAWAASDKSFIMATGGGAPCFHQGIDIINTTGTSIFLDVSIDELINRVGEDTSRPLLDAADIKAKKERLLFLREQRYATYRKAMITLLNPSLDEALHAIRFRT